MPHGGALGPHPHPLRPTFLSIPQLHEGPCTSPAWNPSFFRAVSPAPRGSNWKSFVPHSPCHTPGAAKLLSTARHTEFGLFHLNIYSQKGRVEWGVGRGRAGERPTGRDLKGDGERNGKQCQNTRRAEAGGHQDWRQEVRQ